MNKTQLCVLALLAGTALPAAAQIDTTLARHDAFVKASIATGANKDFTRAQSTAAVTTISGEQTGRRSSKNISDGLVGLGGNGLVSMRNAGTYFSANPTFYVRGLQSLSGSAPALCQSSCIISSSDSLIFSFISFIGIDSFIRGAPRNAPAVSGGPYGIRIPAPRRLHV